MTASMSAWSSSLYPIPSTSVSTPAVTKAISGSNREGISGVVCRAMPSHTVRMSVSSTP
ncbi:Uncharacterised protein [Mycobacteroides abscessus subsp. abscessus]|nr:Uncharacterised protein [Mycobacteroides abscessus subsp. abscessus]